MRYFTSIGSRETPPNILDQITDICAKLCSDCWVLRSGGADGADLASEKGCDFVNGRKEIYLPWKGFNNNNSPLYRTPKEAYDIAAKIHPVWDKLSYGAKKLHARNCCQVLGQDLKTPSKFVVCWTKGGRVIGGTATAIKLAINNNIPVYSLAIDGDYDKVIEYARNQI